MHSLYRYFSADGALLYIGISNAPFTRIGRIEVEWFSTKSKASDAERRAIASESPAWNDHYMTKRPPIKRVQLKIPKWGCPGEYLE